MICCCRSSSPSFARLFTSFAILASVVVVSERARADEGAAASPASSAPAPAPVPAPASTDAPSAATPSDSSTAPSPAPSPASSPALHGPSNGDKPKEAEDHDVYLSFSPIHLLFPIVEVAGEVRLHRNIGVSLIAGYGSVKGTTPLGDHPRFSVWEVGGQFTGYPVGHFDNGMQLGVEVMYVGVSGDVNDGTATISGSGTGLGVGPLVGYKFAAKLGFSFNIQVGAEYIVARAEASSGSANASKEESAIVPVLNANLGWSF